jgi:hypothetical protein
MDLNTSHTLGWAGRNNSNLSSGSSGHSGDTRTRQTHKKPEDLSTREREERGRWECVCVYVTRDVITNHYIYCCLSWIDKSRAKDKTSIWGLLFIIRVNRDLKRVYRNGCRCNKRLNAETGGSKTPHTLGCVGKHIVSLVLVVSE